MASGSNTTTFGATIVPTPSKTDSQRDLTLPPILDSPALTPAVSREDLNPENSERRVPPHSPFYQHPCDSFERGHSRQNSKANVPLNEKDLEAGVQTPLSPEDPNNAFTSKVSVDVNKECRMWPSKQTLIQEKLAEKKKKRDRELCGGCGPVRDFWGRLSKRQKLTTKIVLALFLVGVVVAIAVGISVAVNGTVYSGEGHNAQIPDPGDS